MTRNLPVGWHWRELGSLATLKSGGTPSRREPEYWGGGIPWFSAKDLKALHLHSSVETLTERGAAKLAMVPAGTPLILVRGMGLFKDIPVGLTMRPSAFNQDVKAVVPFDIDARFLAYALQARRRSLMSRVDLAGHGTGRLSTDFLLSEPIAVAPQHEQGLIANALEVWDRAISRLDATIALKRRRKEALLIQACSKLDRRPFLEAATVRFSGVDKKVKANERPVALCNYMDVFHNSRITADIDFMRGTASEREIKHNALRRHDVVFTKDSETGEDIAEPALVEEDIENLVCGYHLAIARPKQDIATGPFLAQVMRHPVVRRQFTRLANGVVRFGLTLDAVENVEIFLPSLDVQGRISAILDGEDRSIEALSRQAKLLRIQKSGLMQRLMMGENRLAGAGGAV